jgi:hypothetical protein
MDAAVIDLFSAMTALTTRTNQEVTRRVPQQIAERMGQLPLVNGRVTSSGKRFSTRGGTVFREGRTLHLSWVSFQRISDGAPALTDRLWAKGSADLKYDLRSSAAFDAGEEH